jgi:hypothetical protein
MGQGAAIDRTTSQANQHVFQCPYRVSRGHVRKMPDVTTAEPLARGSGMDPWLDVLGFYQKTVQMCVSNT